MFAQDGNGGQTPFQKTWEVLFPYLLYDLVFNGAYILLAFACQAVMGYLDGAHRQFMTAYAATISGVVGGGCRLLAIWPLAPMLRRELLWRGETSGTGRGRESEGHSAKESGKQVKTGIFTVVFAVCVSLGLNILFSLTGFTELSASYQEVAERQYGVAFGIGLFLFCVISPLAEEVVFRGVIYNRLRRFLGPVIAVISSGILFGVFHGNLVQGVYGACIGILIAYLYERKGRFFVPLLFHGAANLAVYVTAHMEAMQEKLFTPAACGVLLAAAAGCVVFTERGRRVKTGHGSNRPT